MSDLVPADRIEAIVGARRHLIDHIGRAVSAEDTVYILHSHACKNSGIDLRDCPFSLALDDGIDPTEWLQDMPTRLAITDDGRLVPSDDDGDPS
jgi:hypothetical protein